MSQAVPSLSTNPFTQVNLTKEALTGAYDNAEVIAMTQGIYHFAQQKMSRILPHIMDVGSTNALFVTKDRFGKFEWTRRTKNYEETPHSVHTNSQRSFALEWFHAGHVMDRDQIRQTIYQIQPQVQLELSYSLGRTMDRVILKSLGSSVLEYTSTASDTFQGVKTPSTVSFPSSNVILLGSKQTATTKTLIRWTSYAVDELVHEFESADWEIGDICVILTPEIRRQLKKIEDFRDAENNQSFHGDENRGVLNWRGIKWLYVSESVKPPAADTAAAGTVKFEAGSQFAKTSSSGQALSGFGNYANRLITYAFTKQSLMYRAIDSGVYSRIAVRYDMTDAVELFTRAAFGSMRIDDAGVRQIVFSNAEPGTNDSK